MWVRLRIFRNGGIVQEIPNIVEGIAGTIGPERSVNGKEPRKFASHFQRVRPVNFGEHILGGVGPLIESIEGSDSVAPYSGITGEGTYGVVTDLGKAERCVRIARKILLLPARGIDARLIEQGGAKCVIPDSR